MTKIEFVWEFRETRQLSAMWTCLWQFIFVAKYSQGWRQRGARNHPRVCVCVCMSNFNA